MIPLIIGNWKQNIELNLCCDVDIPASWFVLETSRHTRVYGDFRVDIPASWFGLQTSRRTRVSGDIQS